MGRIKTTGRTTKSYSVSMNRDEYEQMLEAAQDLGMTFTEFARHAMRQVVKNHGGVVVLVPDRTPRKQTRSRGSSQND